MDVDKSVVDTWLEKVFDGDTDSTLATLRKIPDVSVEFLLNLEEQSLGLIDHVAYDKIEELHSAVQTLVMELNSAQVDSIYAYRSGVYSTYSFNCDVSYLFRLVSRSHIVLSAPPFW